MKSFGDLKEGDTIWFYDCIMSEERTGKFQGFTDFGDPYRVCILNTHSPFDIPVASLGDYYIEYGRTLICCDEIIFRFIGG